MCHIAIVRSGVTDDTTTQSTGYPRSKFQSTPTKRRQLVQQAWPADATLSQQQRCPIALLLDGIAIQRDTGNYPAHPSVGIQSIGAVASSKRGQRRSAHSRTKL